MTRLTRERIDVDHGALTSEKRPRKIREISHHETEIQSLEMNTRIRQEQNPGKTGYWGVTVKEKSTH
jgi:hypothetical protein